MGENKTFEAPVFTPPTPTFEPPKHTGPSCYYHKDEPAVSSCARCGKHLCSDCHDSYKVAIGEYAGKALCYDCCRELVQENVDQLTANKKKIKTQFIISIIGMVLGFIAGLTAGFGDGVSNVIAGVVGAGVGGVFLSFMKSYLFTIFDVIKGMVASIFDGSGWAGVFGSLIGGIIRIFIEAFKCVFVTIRNTFYYINYLKETSGFIEADTAALEQMKDYMEYTLIRNQNKGVDLETLMQGESKLANNSYARIVEAQGEEKAEASIRQCVATINENGEIIRSFAA